MIEHRTAGMCFAQPSQQRRRRLLIGEATDRGRHKQSHQWQIRAGLAVEYPHRLTLGLHVPMADAQQRQLGGRVLGGDAIGHAEQVGQPMHSRQLRALVDQHTQLNGGAFHGHCQFSPCYCRCSQSSGATPAKILGPSTHHEATSMAKQALILIDIQNDYFPQGKWPLDGVQAAADKALQVLQAFRQAGNAVIHVRHEFTSEDAPFFTPGPDGALLHN